MKRLTILFCLPVVLSLNSMLLAGGPICNNCTFLMEDATFSLGTTDQEIPVLATNDVDLYGYSIGVRVDDPASVEITEITCNGTFASSISTDFCVGGVSSDGETAGIGVVLFDEDLLTLAFGELPPGSNQSIAIVKVNIVAVAAGTTDISFEAVTPGFSPAPTENIMTNTNGGSIIPAVQNATLTFVEAPIGGQFHRGDSNNDGATNLPDAQYSLNNLFLGGPDPVCPDAADANDDGGFNIADAQYTLNFLFLGGPAPKDPGQVNCGVDPTTDDTLPECLDPRNTCP